MIDLAPHHLETILGILTEHVPDCEVRAFGSRARWDGQDHSDLDLAVVSEDEDNGQAIEHLKEAFEESDLPIRVDVLDWHAITEDFRTAIESDCVVLQHASEFSDWREMTVGDFAPFSYGKSLPASRRSALGKVPVYGSNGVTGYHDYSLTNGPTVIIGRKGTAGAVHYSPIPCWPIDTTFFITGRDAELVRFKYYALSALRMETMNADSAVPGLNRNAAHSLEMRIPSEQEQRAIARLLGALDDRIELNRRMSETLEETAQTLFKSWFIDFDPARTKAEGRPSGLALDLDALFPSTFEESQVGMIPAGWQVLPVGEAVEVKGGSTPSTQEPGFWDGEHCFATPRDLSTLRQPVLASTTRRLTDAGVAQIPSRLLPVGTVLLSSRAPIGYLAITETPASINQGIIAMICAGPVGPAYAMHWARASMDAIRTRGSGSTFAEISKSSFRDIPILFPGESLHAAWESLTRPLWEGISLITREQVALVALRTTLLPLLLSGTLRGVDNTTRQSPLEQGTQTLSPSSETRYT